jgi:hypothetical protein
MGSYERISNEKRVVVRRGKSAVAKGDTHGFFRPENNTGGDTPARFVGTSLGRCRAL